MKTFTEKVLDIVAKIPSGKTLTYKEVARKAGSEGASRAVGMIMSKNQDKHVPCHRVVRSDGSVGGYNGLQGKDKKAIIENEKRLITQTCC
jgi:O-6-methylguanine DNA methyltransferase